jgi:hypothetical protein
MYVLNQKINNLEEKISVIDNFSQSIFNFITSKNDTKEKEEEKEVTYSNNNVIHQVLKPSLFSASNVVVEADNENEETDSESEFNVYNSNVEKDDNTTKSEVLESKELLSEMVAELKDSLIKTNEDNLNNDLEQVQELKNELNENSSSNELFNLLNSVPGDNVVSMDVPIENVTTNTAAKKKEDLTKMNLNELKNLAKKKNISTMVSNKPKKKEVLIQDLLEVI